MDLPCTRRVEPVHQSPRTRMYGYFTQGTVPPSRPCSSGSPPLPDHLRQLPSPTQSGRRLRGFSPACGTTQPSDYCPSFARPFALRLLVRLHQCHPETRPVLLRSRTVLLYRTVASTLVRWEHERLRLRNAGSTLPHLWPTGSSSGWPLIDYGPVLLLMPFGFHLTMDTLPSGATARGGFTSALAVSGFRFRARLGVSIPSSSLRPARHYPRFRIRHSSSEHRRDFNPPEQCAAQRTLCPLLTSAPRSVALLPVASRTIKDTGDNDADLLR